MESRARGVGGGGRGGLGLEAWVLGCMVLGFGFRDSDLK